MAAAMLLASGVVLSGSAAHAATGGTIRGHLTDNGAPVANAAVRLFDTNFQYGGSTTTDADGAYIIPVATPGDYKMLFELPGYLQQWAHQKSTFAEADLITVGDADVTVDESVAPHGSVAGHVTHGDGTPGAYVHVVLYNGAGQIPVQGQTDANGDYSLPYVPAGTYKASFQIAWSGPVDWAHQKTTMQEADAFTVTVGQQTTLDEQMLATGAIVGHITDGGQPVSGVQINAVSQSGQSLFAYTGPDGSYRMEGYPGTYQVSFQLPNGLRQYAHGKSSSHDADPIVVTAGTDTSLEEQVLPTGKISGHLHNSDGTPATGISVSVNNPGTYLSAYTDDAGFYEVTAFPGTYVVNFRNASESLWAHATTDPTQAARITVNAGLSTTVDDTFLPTGSLTVTARDAKTHQPITSFCANVDGSQEFQCVENGTASFAAVGPGTRSVTVSSDAHSAVPYAHVNVVSGQHASIVVDLAPTSTVKTIIRDTATGQPVANACLEMANVASPSSLGTGQTACSGADGKVVLTNVTAATYAAFVWAQDGVHGDQFVGPNGGVGAAVKAKVVTVKMGETVTLAPVKLDKAGAISGVATDAVTGQGIQYASVGIASFDAGFGGGRGQVMTDATGHYTFSALGPYDWPIFTSGYQFASVWSGNTPNRLLSTGVKVKANTTTTYNVALRKGTTLSGVVTGPDGGPADGGRITVVNAFSGDEVGSGDTSPDGTYSVPVFGPQIVKLRYYSYGYSAEYQGWYGHATDFASATPVIIPASGTKTVNVAATIPAQR